MPIADTTQSVAAVVRPITEPLAWMIVPAPRKPMPDTICAAMRPGSAFAGFTAMLPIATDISVSSVAPTQIRRLVRKPAALRRGSRAGPTAPTSGEARSSAAGRAARGIPATRSFIVEPPALSVVQPAQLLEQPCLVLRLLIDLLDHAGRLARGDHARRHVAGDD